MTDVLIWGNDEEGEDKVKGAVSEVRDAEKKFNQAIGAVQAAEKALA